LKTRGANPVTDGGGDLLRFNRPARAYAAKFHPCEASLYHADRNADIQPLQSSQSPRTLACARYVSVCVEKATL